MNITWFSIVDKENIVIMQESVITKAMLILIHTQHRVCKVSQELEKKKKKPSMFHTSKLDKSSTNY